MKRELRFWRRCGRAWGTRVGRAGEFFLLLLPATLLVAAGTDDRRAVDQEDARCLECHARPDIAEMPAAERRLMVIPAADNPGKTVEVRPGLYMGPDALGVGVHPELRCIDCHEDARDLPHPAQLERDTCASSCHADANAAYRSSSHAAARSDGVPDAPTCTSCHGSHAILPSSERESPSHPFHAVRLCGDCHEEHVDKAANGRSEAEQVEFYLGSVHGRALTTAGMPFAATCADCHDHHRSLPSTDPGSSTYRDRIPETCGSCHIGVMETYASSIHGTKLAEGDPNAPVCTDCHTGHEITRAGTPKALIDIVTECGICHDRKDMRQGRRASLYRTYLAGYHGKVTRIGSVRAARCSDCHGSHDILPITDPESRLFGAHRVETCRSCHAGAPPRFAQYDPHADYLDRAHYPLLHGVWWYFVVVISGALGFFGLHSVLWLLRAQIERIHHGPHPRPVAKGHAIRRFGVMDRFNHALLIVSFFGLSVTGLPLFFADRGWAMKASALVGGGDVMGVLHRICGVILLINVAIHFLAMVQKARTYKGPLLKDWLTGPLTMLPRWRDLTDCIAMFRWFLFGGKKPTFDRWAYWEKFDYLAEIFGTGLIGFSGLMLWFPIFFSSFLPGWVFNVAAIVHGYEALLAVAFIFTIHFFNAHLRLEKFPVDDVIFTGQIPEEEFKHERGDEYARALATDKLDQLKVPPAPAWQRKVALGIAALAATVGLSVVALIITAGYDIITAGLDAFSWELARFVGSK